MSSSKGRERVGDTDVSAPTLVPGSSVTRLTRDSLAAALAEADTPEQVADLLLDLGVPLARGVRGACYLSEGDRLELVGERYSSGTPERLDLSGDDPAARALAVQRILLVDGEAYLPLHADDQAFGVLVIAFASASPDESHLQFIARQGARALQRVVAVALQRRALLRYDQLKRASAALARSTDLAATIENILDAFVPELASGCAIDLGGPRVARGEVSDSPTHMLPLAERGHELGTLMLYGTCPSQQNRALLEEIARRSAIAIDTARLLRDRDEAIQLRDDFLNIAGHELRTPLATLRMWLYAIERFGPAAPIDTKTASRQLRRIEQLIDRFLDVSRLREDELVLELDEFDLVALVREIAAGYDSVRVVAPGGVRGRWDRFRLGQVVTSLLSNAVQYGSGRPVEIRVDANERVTRIVVRDRGIGIDPASHARIFERFERDVSSSHYPGLGLGLWIARRIVHAHGGQISVRSEPGDGSEFTVELARGVA